MATRRNPFRRIILPRPPLPDPPLPKVGIVKPPCELNIKAGEFIPQAYIDEMNKWIQYLAESIPFTWNSQGCVLPGDPPATWSFTAVATGASMIGRLKDRANPDSPGGATAFAFGRSETTYTLISDWVTFMPAHVRFDGGSGYGVYLWDHGIFNAPVGEVLGYLNGGPLPPTYPPFSSGFMGGSTGPESLYQAVREYPDGKPELTLVSIQRLT